jgi:hypothetical protein
MSEHNDRIPAGRYLGRCTGAADAQFGYSKNGNEQIALSFELLNEGFEGERVTWFGSFASEEATKITMRTLRDCGWETDSVTDLAGIEKNEVEIAVKYETWEGKRRMKVGVFAPGGGQFSMPNQMDEKQKNAFAAKLKGAAMKSRPTGSATPNGGKTPF